MDIITQRQAVEQLLSANLAGRVRLDQGNLLDDRSHVARFQVLDGPAHAPASVIAKGWRSWNEMKYDPESDIPRSPSMRLFDDWAGLQFLNKVMGKVSPAPYFIAGDREAGYFIMEDIGTGQNPADGLLGSDPVLAKAQMVALAAALGRMHAATAGRKIDFEQLRSGFGPLPIHEEEQARQMVSRWLAALEQLGITLTQEPEMI